MPSVNRFRRRGHCCTITLLHINKFNEIQSAIFVSLICFLLPENLLSEGILSSLQLVLCRLAAVKRLPVHHNNAGYFFWFFGITVLILSQFKASARGRRQCCTITLLHMNRLNKTESDISVLFYFIFFFFFFFFFLLLLICSLLPEDFHSELILAEEIIRFLPKLARRLY